MRVCVCVFVQKFRKFNAYVYINDGPRAVLYHISSRLYPKCVYYKYRQALARDRPTIH